MLWGLAWDGEDGVSLVLDILRDETDLVLGHCGHTTVETLDRSVVNLPHGFAGCTCRLP